MCTYTYIYIYIYAWFNHNKLINTNYDGINKNTKRYKHNTDEHQ